MVLAVSNAATCTCYMYMYITCACARLALCSGQVWTLLRRLPRALVDSITPSELIHLKSRRSDIELHALALSLLSSALPTVSCTLGGVYDDMLKAARRAASHADPRPPCLCEVKVRLHLVTHVTAMSRAHLCITSHVVCGTFRLGPSLVITAVN